MWYITVKHSDTAIGFEESSYTVDENAALEVCVTSPVVVEDINVTVSATSDTAMGRSRNCL